MLLLEKLVKIIFQEKEMSKVCHQCGNEYQQIGNHWVGNSSCSHKEFTDYQREIITGILMGDGSISIIGKNPQLRVKMISPNYLQYVADKFGILGNGVKTKMTAAESSEQARKSGFNPNAKKENYSDVYEWCSISHPELHEFEDWYSSGEKVWPKDIKLTPTVLKHWYCGDGHWDNSGSNNHIEIEMANEVNETEKVNQMFESVGLPTPSNYSIGKKRDRSTDCSAQFTVDQSKELWQYMGDPLPGFEYKWPKEYY